MKKQSRIFRTIVVFLALFLFWIIIAPFLAERLIVEKSLERADAILILGGSSAYLERTQKAAEIYKKGVAPKIFLTDDGDQAGWSQTEQKNPSFVELARRSLIEQGVDSENIEILEPEVAGTIDEARILSQKVRTANLHSVLLVTSAYHTRRALWAFERVLAENDSQTALGITAPPPGRQTPPIFSWWLSPLGWRNVGGEYLKTFVYWVYY